MKKKENNRVNQEGNEYAFEYNADKIDKEDSDNEQENKNEEKKSTWKSGDILEN